MALFIYWQVTINVYWESMVKLALAEICLDGLERLTRGKQGLGIEAFTNYVNTMLLAPSCSSRYTQNIKNSETME